MNTVVAGGNQQEVSNRQNTYFGLHEWFHHIEQCTFFCRHCFTYSVLDEFILKLCLLKRTFSHFFSIWYFLHSFDTMFTFSYSLIEQCITSNQFLEYNNKIKVPLSTNTPDFHRKFDVMKKCEKMCNCVKIVKCELNFLRFFKVDGTCFKIRKTMAFKM